jgi:GrpB-like predicted nucleotidyltransferase (UPF0157 family)
VRLADPDVEWARLFNRERHILTTSTGGAFENIAHFGSTAVPGLRAKPIIDIMASVDALFHVDAVMPALLGLGYEPAEVGFLKRRFLRKQPTTIGVGYHLHIIANAAWPHKNELLVRDWLIARPEVAASYAALKETLAQKHPDDMPAYTAAKSAFLRTVVNDARRSRGLPPETDWME